MDLKIFSKPDGSHDSQRVKERASKEATCYCSMSILNGLILFHNISD